jgi:peptide/nickel transport system substrate-binding protein
MAGKMNIRFRFLNLIVPGMALLATSCSSPKGAPKDTLTIVVSAAVQTLNPLYTTDAVSQQIGTLIHAPLLELGEDLRPKPYLAQEWNILSPLRWEFRLRPGCTFASGRPLNADAVKRSLQAFLDEKNGSAFRKTFSVISGFEKKDDLTFVLTLKEPTPSLSTDMTLLKIMDLEAIDLSQKPTRIAGAGPYQVKEFDSQGLLLERSQQKCLPSPPSEKIAVRVVRDDLSRFLKLKTGEVDVVFNELNLRKVEKIENDPSLPMKVLRGPGLSYSYIGLNLLTPGLSDVRVREALSLAIDREMIIRYKSRGMAQPARNLLADSNFFANLKVPIARHDLNRAKDLLHKAGYSNGSNGMPPLKIVLKTTSNPLSVENARVIIDHWKKAGVNVKHEAYDWGIFYRDVKAGNTQAFILRWVGVTDPKIFFEVFHSGEFERNNRTRYKNEKLDQLLTAAEKEMNPESRKALYDKIQEIVALEFPYIGLWYADNVLVARKNVQGLRLWPNGSWRTFLEAYKL